jgi:deoxycytidylate deaminase
VRSGGRRPRRINRSNIIGITEHDLHAIHLASEIAEESDYRQRHGAVLFHRRHIISVGYNRKKTHPKALPFYRYPFLHAEADSIIKADSSDIEGAAIACVRINKSGYLMNSRPCPECINMMQHYNISYIVYSSKDGIKKELL